METTDQVKSGQKRLIDTETTEPRKVVATMTSKHICVDTHNKGNMDQFCAPVTSVPISSMPVNLQQVDLEDSSGCETPKRDSSSDSDTYTRPIRRRRVRTTVSSRNPRRKTQPTQSLTEQPNDAPARIENGIDLINKQYYLVNAEIKTLLTENSKLKTEVCKLETRIETQKKGNDKLKTDMAKVRAREMKLKAANMELKPENLELKVENKKLVAQNKELAKHDTGKLDILKEALEVSEAKRQSMILSSNRDQQARSKLQQQFVWTEHRHRSTEAQLQARIESLSKKIEALEAKEKNSLALSNQCVDFSNKVKRMASELEQSPADIK